MRKVATERMSEYYEGLSGESKGRYTVKMTKNGLVIDPFAIPSNHGGVLTIYKTRRWTEK